jgi:hypothetical protein
MRYDAVRALQGIEVKMVTGDHLKIGKETARQLGMGDKMWASEVLIEVRPRAQRRGL